jgi:hypothetical protein
MVVNQTVIGKDASALALAKEYQYIDLDVGAGYVNDDMLTPTQYWKMNPLSNGIPEMVMQFLSGGSQYIYFRVKLPEDCDDASNITMWPTWKPTTADAGNAQFLVYAKRFASGDARNVAVNTLVLTTTASASTGTAGTMINGAESSPFAIGGTGKNLMIKIMRASDSLPATIELLQMHMKIIVTKAATA